MKSAIVYYSRTGATASVARALAAALAADVFEIGCPRYRPGWLRYLLAGYDSLRGRLPPIDVAAPDLAQYDLVVLAAPIWTSYPALPLRAFLARSPRLPRRVALALTSGGHSEPKNAVEMTRDLLKSGIEEVLLVQEKDAKGPGLTKRADEFAGRLQAETIA